VGWVTEAGRDLPGYWLRRPGPPPSAALRHRFDDLLARAVEDGPETPLDYRLDPPLWQFLCHVADDGRFVLHGSGRADITTFEPRQSDDIDEFGARTAVYAAGDGIWPMYFAIVNRPTVHSLINACMRYGPAADPDAGWSDPRYFFSVNADALTRGAFREGTVYLLPADGFEPQPIEVRGDRRIRIAQLASRRAVQPAAKVTVRPADFPFLAQVRGHDQEAVTPRAIADPQGFPWLDPA
jgi:hypothetical protein